MRRLAAAVPLLMLLAGCAEPGQDRASDPLFGVCPQWAQGHGGQTGGVSLSAGGSASRELGPAADRHLDKPLDLFRVTLTRIDVDGAVELRAFAADGQRLSIRDYRLEDAQMVPVATLDAEAQGHEFDVFLSPVLQDAPAAPLPATLNWTLQGQSAVLEYNVTYHYKVCGA